MRIWRMIVVPAVLLLSVGSIGSAAAGESSTFVDYGRSAVTDGEYIVWTQQSFDNGRDGTHLFAEKIATGERMHIIDRHDSIGGIDLDSGTVVWSQRKVDPDDSQRTIFGFNLDSSELIEISDIDGNHDGATISGDIVIWQRTLWLGGNEHSHSIMGRNIMTMDEPFVVHDGESINVVELDGDRVLWQEQDQRSHWRLMTMRIGEAVPEPIAEGVNISPGGSFGYDIAGDIVVYVDGPTQLTAVNLETGNEIAIPAEPYDMRPVTNGRYVFWSGNDPNESMRRLLMGYDLETHSRFVVHGTGSSERTIPSIGGDYVTWRLGTGDSSVHEIHIARIEDVLPSSPRPVPIDESPHRTWFPETGHSIVFGFKNFWEASGGLPVFGFPLSHEFDELNQDTGEYRTVQYFERQRFEYHPENAGTPYEVLLGRLGVEDAARRGLLDADAFQPTGEDPDTDQCHYFETTGFAVCNEFLDYWLSHGLDFGDDGISYRESLALFGYPISQVYFSEPGTGAEPVTVQYFERGRFEFHPSNPEEHRVLLGRLGADLLDLRDW